MLSQWLWIMLCYACESWLVILSQWLWIMVCHHNSSTIDSV
jgi:hypothetical protein